MYILTEFQYSKPEVSKIQQVGLAINYHQSRYLHVTNYIYKLYLPARFECQPPPPTWIRCSRLKPSIQYYVSTPELIRRMKNNVPGGPIWFSCMTRDRLLIPQAWIALSQAWISLQLKHKLSRPIKIYLLGLNRNQLKLGHNHTKWNLKFRSLSNDVK